VWEENGMKVFIWRDVDTMSQNYHSDGGVVVFAETEGRARELANVGACAIRPDEMPDEVRDVAGGAEKVFYMPNAGCC
jgi:hypothetical protein